jgi:serine phosphatase RsbU (regulator of sigma subunit)
MAFGSLSIDEYLRRRLMPVEGAIPQLAGIEMYGNSVPAEIVGGDLFEYINFEQRYNVDARIANAHRLAEEYLHPLARGTAPRNEVDAHVRWLQSRPGYSAGDGAHYRRAKGSEQSRVAQNLADLKTTAGVLLVDAQGHGVIAAKIASTVHDTFHAFMLSELDLRGKVTFEFCEKLNLRLAQSVTARNALGRSGEEGSREIATMLYGEVRPHGGFRFVSFGHPPPLVFSARFEQFMEIHSENMVKFLALGLEIPEDHPDRSRYISMKVRKRRMNPSDVAQITLMGQGDVLFLHTDGVYDGTDPETRLAIEGLIRQHKAAPAKQICNAILDYALEQDRTFRERGEPDRIDDKTVFIIKRT